MTSSIRTMPMTRANMKDIFNQDPKLNSYLWHKNSTTSVCTYEAVQLRLSNMMDATPPETTLEQITTVLKKIYKVDDSLIERVINETIDDYNNYYLNDSYYYNGYWTETGWIKTEEQCDVDWLDYSVSSSSLSSI